MTYRTTNIAINQNEPLAKRLRLAMEKIRLGFLIGLAISGIGLAFLWGAGQVRTLTCQRVETHQIECVIQIKLLGLLPLGEQPVHHLQGASVSTGCSENGESGQESCVYGVKLQTAQGEVSLSPPIVSGERRSKEELVRQINNFIGTHSMTSLHEVYSEIGLGLMPIFIILLAGSAILWVSTAIFIKTIPGQANEPATTPRLKQKHRRKMSVS